MVRVGFHSQPHTRQHPPFPCSIVTRYHWAWVHISHKLLLPNRSIKLACSLISVSDLLLLVSGSLKLKTDTGSKRYGTISLLVSPSAIAIVLWKLLLVAKHPGALQIDIQPLLFWWLAESCEGLLSSWRRAKTHNLLICTTQRYVYTEHGCNNQNSGLYQLHIENKEVPVFKNPEAGWRCLVLLLDLYIEKLPDSRFVLL